MPANALAYLAVPVVLALGLLAAVVEPVAPGAAAALASLAGWAAAWLELVARLVASLPGAQIGARTAFVGALAAVAAWLALRHGGPRLGTQARTSVALAAAGGLLLVAAGWWAARPAPAWDQPAGLRVTFLDVGQGDAVLLETPSARVLVDQGPPEGDVAGQLARMGIRSLSAVVLTHPQRDHVGGAAEVISRLRVGTVLDPHLAATGPDREEAVAAARQRRVPVRLVRTGSEFKVGGLVLHTLWPPDPGLAVGGPEPERSRPRRILRRDRRLPAGGRRVGRDLPPPSPLVRGAQGRASRLRRPGARRAAPRPSAEHRRNLGRPRQRLRPSAGRDAGRAGDASPSSPSTEPTCTGASWSSPTAGNSGSERRDRVDA